MSAFRVTCIVFAAASMAACGVIHRNEPVTQITSTGVVAASTRWNATLATPAELAGAVQVRGTGYWASANNGGSSQAVVYISNVTPGGQHPWALHRGRCGSDEGLIGSESTYPILTVDAKGNASAAASVTQMMPTSGDYFFQILASPQNRSTVIACGNLAPPVQ